MDAADGVTIDWAPPGRAPVPAVCRNCGADGPKAVMLTAHARLPDQARIDVRMLDCPACGCAFAEHAPSYDYEGEAGAQTVANYAQAGAGLWPIVRTLARLKLPPGARFLEIGCGFGFGLDYAIRARGWQGLGVDPSALAAAGRVAMDLPIESRFFGEAEDVGGADCIMASEVLEHMADPGGFVMTLRRGLKPGGVLVLTTPDRAQLNEGVSHAEQVPLLSAGAHLVLQTSESLRSLLERCGLAHVEVRCNGAQLVAYASAAALVLERDDAATRRSFRTYLDGRADGLESGSMLWWAFAGRAYQEAVADTDSQAAARLWGRIRPAWRDAFGVDPESPVWPREVPEGAGLDWLAAQGPHALPGLLYARALDRRHGGASLGELAEMMRVAADAAAGRNAVLLRMGAVELATLGVRRAALEVLAAVAADEAAADWPEVLEEAVAADPERRLGLVRRSFVGLVNAGALAEADALRARWDIGADALQAAHSAQERDVLLCLGIAKLAVSGREDDAIACFGKAMRASGPDEGAWWSALRGVCVAQDRAGRHGATVALLEGAPVGGMPEDLRKRKEGLLF